MQSPDAILELETMENVTVADAETIFVSNVYETLDIEQPNK